MVFKIHNIINLLQAENESLIITNSLTLAESLSSPIKYFSDALLTISCSYALSGYNASINYTVVPNNLTFQAEPNTESSIDVRLVVNNYI